MSGIRDRPGTSQADASADGEVKKNGRWTQAEKQLFIEGKSQVNHQGTYLSR